MRGLALRRHALAVLLTLLALSLGLLGHGAWGGAAASAFFLGAVMLSSWLGGLGPGIVSTVLGVLAADYFLIPPVHEIRLDAEKLIQLSVLLTIAVVISSLNDARRRALAALEEERLRLEERVAARTADLTRSESEQRRLVHDLGERVKELTALHATGRLLNEDVESRALLTRIAALLPPAWQYPDVATARIAIGDLDIRTPGFRHTPWMQRAEFHTYDGRTGIVEVAYTEGRPPGAEGPFLAEERNLIESFAGMLRAYFDRLQAETHRVTLARAEEARLRAQEANDAKDQFLATLSHELRSPLNVMSGWIEMLRAEHVGDDMRARGLEVLERSVRVQTKLIDDLLDVSRIVAGKLGVELRRVDLARIAIGVIDALTPAVLAKHVTLTHAIAPSLWMQGDPQRLQQVLSNLLTNAVKFTPEHGAIDVRIDRTGERADIVVSDTGIGIAPDMLPKIFDRFQQGSASTAQTYGGLGLGLAIVKHLVEQHGGAISAASAGAHRGSTFTISLPLVAAREEPIDLRPSAASPGLLAGVRVLVVDDEAEARKTIGALLEQFGAETTVVSSAREAVEQIARSRPDVLLSDLAMEGEDGFALIRRIRTSIEAADLPAAALTAYLERGTKHQALDAGFQECLAKPIAPSVLANSLARLVHRGSPPARPSAH